ncbi:unnamed protein product, partial [Prorocentrum cordatum]
MANCAAPHRVHLQSWPALEGQFGEMIFSPVAQSLEELARCPDDAQADTVAQGMQALITRLDLDFLGPHYTRVLLRHMGCVDPASFAAEEGRASAAGEPAGAPRDEEE